MKTFIFDLSLGWQLEFEISENESFGWLEAPNGSTCSIEVMTFEGEMDCGLVIPELIKKQVNNHAKDVGY